MTAKLLTTGYYEFYENDTDYINEKWFGLFFNNLGTYLAETKIKIDISQGSETFWKVQTINESNPIILISGLDFLTNRKIQQPDLSEITDAYSRVVIYPEDSLKFNYLGVDYKIYATGGKKKDPRFLRVFVWNYKLYLTANKNGQVITELLVAKPNANDMITIEFAGDIDGDGVLDLLINTQMYAIENLVLYLSKPADKGHFLKIVGQYQSFGC